VGLASSFVLYLLIGGGVAAAVYVRGEQTGGRGVFPLGLACLFWPLYVPALLAGREREMQISESATAPPSLAGGDDELTAAIVRVEAELERAFRSLDGWAEETLSTEHARLVELKQAWRFQAARIRELTALLDETQRAEPAEDAVAASLPSIERIHHSERSRRENIDRLRSIRDRMRDELLGTLAWVRELVTMIHLAKYTGAPASRAEELVSQIAASVEGLREVSEWRDRAASVA
jgi:hypothetical protein